MTSRAPCQPGSSPRKEWDSLRIRLSTTTASASIRKRQSTSTVSTRSQSDGAYTHSIYALDKAYSGGYFTVPDHQHIGTPVAAITSNPAVVGSSANAAFNLQAAAANSTTGVVDCAPSDCPYYNGTQVYLQQVRGIFSSPIAETSSVNMSIYGNDNFRSTATSP